jgi:hypothetical protein
VWINDRAEGPMKSAQAGSRIAKAIAAATEPLVRAMATELTRLAAELVEQHLVVARAHAVSQLTANFERKAPDVEADDQRLEDSDADRKPQHRKPRPPVRAGLDEGADRRSDSQSEALRATEGEEVATPLKSPRKCGACHAVGHRADHCPNLTRPADVVAEPEPANLSVGSDRFSRIEAAARARVGGRRVGE